MAIYLDPKADLTFKKVFGEHKELMISFLNAMLPLPDNGQVEWIEYLEPELIPDHPLKKDTIVDVRCRDARKLMPNAQRRKARKPRPWQRPVT